MSCRGRISAQQSPLLRRQAITAAVVTAAGTPAAAHLAILPVLVVVRLVVVILVAAAIVLLYESVDRGCGWPSGAATTIIALVISTAGTDRGKDGPNFRGCCESMRTGQCLRVRRLLLLLLLLLPPCSGGVLSTSRCPTAVLEGLRKRLSRRRCRL